MTFESMRGGITHRYEVHADRLHYSAGTVTELDIPWRELTRVEPGRGETVNLVPRGRQKIAVWLDAARMNAFLTEAFAAWKRVDRGAALKAASDYASAGRATGWAWIGLGLAFPAMLALILLIDGYHTLACNRLLENGKTAPAQITKIKKDRRGNYVWQLRFEAITASGPRIIEGPRTAFTRSDEKPIDLTVVYSPENLACWDISLEPGKNAINWRQRHLTLLMTMTFGWAFAIIAAIALKIGIGKLRRKYPFREVFEEISHQQSALG
jgi:hypothetical protein